MSKIINDGEKKSIISPEECGQKGNFKRIEAHSMNPSKIIFKFSSITVVLLQNNTIIIYIWDKG